MKRTRAVALAALVSAVALLLSGCTEVPSSSPPETIKQVPIGDQSQGQAINPAPGEPPSDIVRDFLTANGTEPGKHTSARTFLTPAARSRWTDTTITVVSDETIGPFKSGKPVVVVRGRVVGTVGTDGVYTPSLLGSGDGGPSQPFEYTIKKVDGQYRIDNPQKGLLLTTDQFAAGYKPSRLYFFDLAEKYLVPDVRWSGLDGTALQQWLMDQLADGPRADLVASVYSDTLPTQATARRITVTPGYPTKIEIPGSSQLNAAARNQLAIQVGNTLDPPPAASGEVFSITDGGTPVQIPDAGGAQFTATGLPDAATPPAPAKDVYYLRNGRVYGENGDELSGAVNNGSYFLNSVALTRTGTAQTLAVAGVTGPPGASRLVLGTQTGGLRPTSVVGALTRPAWAPGLDEVWIGDGRKLYRVTPDGRTSRVSSISLPSIGGATQILALRLSPEGSRIAMVIASADGEGQLYVGAVARTAGEVRVDTLDLVSPADTVVQDVAWIESTKLFAIGYAASTQDSRIFQTNTDGSSWTSRGIGNLQDPPDTVTVMPNSFAWVSTGDFVWEQYQNDWEGPGGTSQTVGRAPVYLE